MSKYLIYAGTERPAFIVGQRLEKRSGQTMIEQGSEKMAYIVPAGDIGFTNMSEAWGMRLDKEGKEPKSTLSVTSPEYDGKIKFLEWGAKGGSSIIVRWLSGYNTLDQQYQKLVLKADDRISDDTEGVWSIVLKSGLNEFDEKSDAVKIEHLKNHSYNRDSKSKKPDFTNSMFFEKDEVVESKKESKNIDLKWDAIGLVKEASKDNSLHSLRNMKKAVERLISEEVKDEDLYNYLLKLADSEPDKFLAHIEEHKRFISNLFVKANSFKLLDLTKDGIIAAGKDSKAVIGKDIQAKGEGMLEYILSTCFSEESNKTIFALKDITDKIK